MFRETDRAAQSGGRPRGTGRTSVSCIYRMKGGHALAALSGIFGIYRQTREEYGEDLLEIIREHQ